MCDEYLRSLQRIAVAQICQTIGYNSSQTAPLELMQDALHKFLLEFTRDLQRHTQFYNRTETNLNDVCLSLNSLGISVNELIDYISNVEPVPFGVDVPRFPINKDSNLNFLKPGSKEVLTRPVHIFEYLPPILPPDITSSEPRISNDDVKDNSILTGSQLDPVREITVITGSSVDECKQTKSIIKTENISNILNKKIKAELEGTKGTEYSPRLNPQLLDEEGCPIREISSVVMTTGGFISPAIEGKLPDSIIPDLIDKFNGLDAPPPLTPEPAISPEPADVPSQKNASSKVDILPEYNKEIDTIVNKIDPVEQITSGAIAIPSITASINDSDKMHMSFQNQSPIMLNKLLKKMKKKMPMGGLKMDQAEPNLSAMSGFLKSDKIEKKRRKIMQKLSKTYRNPSDLLNFANLDDGQMNPSIIASMPPGPERIQLEKMLKKQNKYKQKKLKQQLALEFKKKSQKAIFEKANLYKLQLTESESPQMNELQHNEKLLTGLKKQHSAGFTKSPPKPLQNIDEAGNLHQEPTASTKLVSSADEFAQVNLNEKNTLKKISSDKKLSMNPDRNKLNIFKKISKQKHSKTSPQSALQMHSLTYSNDQIINLPSGTTITPSLPVGKKLFPPEVISLDSVPSAFGHPNASAIQLHDVSAIYNPTDFLNKPKKRGRKPGSKNHSSATQGTALKKSKKLKLEGQLLCSSSNIIGVSDISEPLNLTNNQFGGNANLGSLYKAGSVKSFPLGHFEKQNEAFEKKERKKKNKNVSLMNTNLDLSLSGPSKDEVNSINKKQKRMDSLLKSQSQALVDLTKSFAENTKDNLLHSPNKGTFLNPLSSGSNRKTLPRNSPILLPGLAGNMFSMMPLYQFPTRPGLIPSTGMFPPSFGNLPGNLANAVGPNVLLPGFLPFTNMKPQTNSTDENSIGQLSHVELRNYCNVPPLVPESMISIDSKSEKVSSAHVNQDCPKTPKPSFSRTDLLTQTVVKKMDSINTPECVSFGSNPSSIPTTPGGISMNTFDSIIRNAGSSDFSPGMLQTFTESPDSKISIGSSPFLKAGDTSKIKHTDNLNDPIEVSDDSTDNIRTDISQTQTLPDVKTEINSTCIKSTVISSFLTNMDDIFVPNSPIADTMSKEGKRLKKANKFPKKSNFLSSSMDVCKPDNSCVGKLAGGADLIPLSSTGNSYSSKTIPPSSLTGSVTPSTKQPFTSANVLDNLTFIPTSLISEPQKPIREHKKIKKIKEGKIKKKKLKKLKYKNKDRFECNDILKSEKEFNESQIEKLNDKSSIKKNKKEKKKDKQRFTTNSSADINIMNPIIEDLTQPTDKVQPTTDLLIPAISVPSLVPKLTLKLASCQSPTPTENSFSKASPKTHLTPSVDQNKREPSPPELARISPLVTRPPKQKTIVGENVNINNPVTSASITVDVIPDNTTVPLNSGINQTLIPPPSPWLSGGTLTASSVLLPQQLLQQTPHTPDQTVTTTDTTVPPKALVTQSSTLPTLSTEKAETVPVISEDAEGNRVWICPACGKVDDGSAMIGCDGCDAWYHWICVGIFIAPKDNEDWFCRVCITRKKGVHSTDKKRKRSNKKK